MKNSILIISYKFHPDKGVGILRPYYWYKSLLMDQEVHDVEVITSTSSSLDNVTHIKSGMSSIKWGFNVLTFLLKGNRYKRFTNILLTGGPFTFFFLSIFIRLFSDCNLILDYRDPFARNPRFNQSNIKTFLKSILEKLYNGCASHIIVVNDYCKNLLVSGKYKATIIRNGFDDETIKRNSLGNEYKYQKHTLVYSGRLYADFQMDSLFSVLTKNKRFVLNHFGEIDKEMSNQLPENYNNFQRVSYDENIKNIRNHEIGLILTGGKPFESTTKIYDYIACNKKILIITEGQVKTGEIHELTKNLPNIFWAKNEENEIQNAIEKAILCKDKEYDTKEFSRGFGYLQLKKLMK